MKPAAPLYGAPFIALLIVVAAGFGGNALIQPILPILILQRGGDAALIGLIFAMFAIPSVLLRPFIGRAVDQWSRVGVFFVGTLGVGLASLFYLLPGLGAVTVGRVVHGTAWAAFNTGGNSTLYELAPAARRGEAAGVYNLMPGLSHMIMPGLGLIMLGSVGFAGPFGLAAALGLIGAAVIVFGPIPRSQPRHQPSSDGFWRSLIERRALVPMMVEFLWTSANTLFFVFPPVFAASRGIPMSELTLYYPLVGLALVGSRLLMARRVDRFARGPVIAAGTVLGILALLVASAAESIAVLTVAGAMYASASTATSPVATALAMDRADPARRGAAMATYSLGYQLGIGSGAALWGFVIDRAGFPTPFLLAIGSMVAMLVMLWWNRADPSIGQAPRPA